jgi:cytochrome c oxidase cbb3-type subunit 3
VDGKGMQEWRSRFNPKQIAQLASYVKSLKGTNPAVHKAPDGPLYVEAVPAAAKDTTGVKKDTVKTTGK